MLAHTSRYVFTTATGLVVLLGSLATGQETKLQLAPQGKYAGMGLDAACEAVLYQQINCDAAVGELGAKRYHGTVGDNTATNSMCSTACSTALNTARRRIVGSCSKTSELIPGYPAVALVESIQAGWNETCQKDKETGKYCNDIMDSFTEVEELSDMPKEELCSYCYGARLRMMQSSPYSAYDEMYAEMLKHVNENCDVDSPIEVLPNPVNINYTESDRCEAERKYTVQNGDTCDSIAQRYSVSGATLYYINPELANCTALTQGTTLCLPDQCGTTYKLQSESEDCVDVATSHGTTWRNIIQWNSGIDSRCTNIWSTEPFWGRVLCVSSPGGDFVPPETVNTTTPGNGNLGGQGGSGDGYSDGVVEPPKGGTVANGTTEFCGVYIQAEQGKGCNTILSRSAVSMNLFLQVNPSLGTDAIKCSDNLVVGTWYCLHPYRQWNETFTE